MAGPATIRVHQKISTPLPLSPPPPATVCCSPQMSDSDASSVASVSDSEPEVELIEIILHRWPSLRWNWLHVQQLRKQHLPQSPSLNN